LYLTNRLEALKQHIDSFPPTDPRLRTLLQLRLAMRLGDDLSDLVESCIEISEGKSELSGESYFLLATAAESRGADQDALPMWRLAAQTLEQSASIKKAVKAEHNAIATQSRLDPTARLLIEYQGVAVKAEVIGEPVVQANAELNLSREYQMIGALQIALRHANVAVDLTRRYQRGGLQYFLSMAHRCHLYLDLNQRKLAGIDYEELQTSSFPEAIACAQVLQKQLQSPIYVKISTKGHALMTASWIERNAKLAAERFELIRELFGSSGDIFSLENRLKQILFRVRKKAPGLIEYKDNKYYFAEHGTQDQDIG
ncbi:MAG: hypothetical protein NTV34_01720, partial [Proteobacteria bacterium]|nr:hypothetical protein [Pseudomonadota bacterium]